MVGCSVIGCKSRSERKIPGITFHSFPSNPGTRAKWVSSSGKLNWTPTKRSKICSIHFDDKALIYKNKIVLLERNSVPTKHIHIKIPGTQDQHFMQQENIFSSQPLTSQHNIINNRPSSTKRSSDVLIEIQNIQTKKKCLMEEELALSLPPPVKKTLIQPEDLTDVASENSELESFTDESKESWKYFIVKWSLYAIIWTSLFAYFITIQFGAVFFAFSVLFGIYFNTRTRPKKKGEVSAYSVFNENCQSIEGTLRAEELERQMLYGAAGVRTF